MCNLNNSRNHGARGSTEGRRLFSRHAAACECVLRPQTKPTRYGHANWSGVQLGIIFEVEVVGFIHPTSVQTGAPVVVHPE